MKKTLAVATIAALAGFAGAANAADLYKGGSLKDAPVYVPAPTWTGFYIGAHVGGAWGDIQNDWDAYCSKSETWERTSWKADNDGVFGGGTVGYNWQGNLFGPSIVLGVEADFGGIGFSNTNRYEDYWSKQESSFYADVTGRLGYAFGPALIYAKGGWAYLDNPNSFGYPSASVNGDSLDGWTVGGGIEYLWSPNWSVKAEYQYFDFGRDTYTVDNYNRVSSELTLNTFKVGLNYHFNQASPIPLK